MIVEKRFITQTKMQIVTGTKEHRKNAGSGGYTTGGTEYTVTIEYAVYKVTVGYTSIVLQVYIYCICVYYLTGQ